MDFYQKYWPCERQDKRGHRCCNVATGHQKGHQSKSGKIFSAGEFYSIFKQDEFGQRDLFINAVSTGLQKLLLEFAEIQLHDGPENEEAAAASLHRTKTLKGCGHLWSPILVHHGQNSGPLTSHTTCFGCLFGTPIHALFCGHILCDRCVDNYCEPLRTGSLEVREIRVCPLCSNEPWVKPWRLEKKPRNAGLRILSLDG